MKTTIMHLMSLFLILSFSASCGKKEGGSSGSNSTANNANSGLNTVGEAAKANLIAWYNTQSEGGIPSLTSGTAKYISRYEKTISTSNGCNAQPISIGGFNLGNLNFCINSNTGGNGTLVQGFETMLVSGDKKSGNAKLAEAMAPVITPGTNGLTLISITQAPSPQGSGSAYTVTFAKVVSGSPKTVVYIIDSAYNSRVNPMVTVDGVNGKQIIYAGSQY